MGAEKWMIYTKEGQSWLEYIIPFIDGQAHCAFCPILFLDFNF